jgi:hypothetical protein
MGLNEWLTLAGIVLSPIIAVLITLWVEGRRRVRDGKMIVVRMLIATRHLASDPAYSTAINLLRVEFAHSRRVMDAFAAYHRVIRVEQATTPQGIELQNTEIRTVQTKLLSAVLKEVGITASEADLAVEGYASDGFRARDNMYLNSLQAQIRTADALERSLAIQAQLSAEAPSPIAGEPL